MNDNEFQNAIVKAIGVELAFSRIVRFRTDRSFAHCTTFITVINLPAGKKYCGAEQENNRTTIAISGDPVERNVRAEQIASVFGRARNMRARTATPTKIADYVGAYIKALLTEVSPKFTHTK